MGYVTRDLKAVPQEEKVWDAIEHLHFRNRLVREKRELLGLGEDLHTKGERDAANLVLDAADRLVRAQEKLR